MSTVIYLLPFFVSISSPDSVYQAQRFVLTDLNLPVLYKIEHMDAMHFTIDMTIMATSARNRILFKKSNIFAMGSMRSAFMSPLIYGLPPDLCVMRKK